MIGIVDFDPKKHVKPPELPNTLKMVSLGLIAVGVVSAIAGLLGDTKQVGIALLVNLVYFVGLSFGGIIFLAAMTITEARWSRPLKRFGEGLALLTPIILVLFIAFTMTPGMMDLYEWHHDPSSVHGHKHIWLQKGIFIGRNVVLLGILSALGLYYVRAGLAPDLSLAKSELGSSAPSWWDSVIGGTGHSEADIASAQKKMMNVSPWIGVFYALGMSLFAFDAVMSLAPHWYANMFGGWYFCSALWTAFIWVGLLSLTMRGWTGTTEYLKPAVYHDLGKLVFAFSMLWAYMFFAQLLPIWYGNMTEEISFLLVRFQLEPWAGMVKIVGVLCFLFPFATLLSRGLKKMPIGFGIVLAILTVGIWLERFMTTAPSIWMEETLPINVWTFGITAGFVGLTLFVVGKYMSSVPALPLTDPYMRPHPDDVHVHPAHDHGHAHAK